MIINSRFLTRRMTGIERYALGVSLKIKEQFPNVEFVAPNDIAHQREAELLSVNLVGRSTGHTWEQSELPLYLATHKNPLLIGPVNTGPLTYHNQIIIIHDLAFLREPRWFTKKAALFFKYMVSGVVKISRHIITNSNFTKKEVHELLGVPEEKITVAYPALSEHILRYKDVASENKYGDYILTVSSLDPRKNLSSVIRAFRQLGDPDLKLVIVGGENTNVFGRHAFDLREIAKENPNIVFTGYISDQEEISLYRNAKIFVYPSLYEGFGFPPLEAMACGCPVVSANTSSLPEVLGDAAVFVDARNIEELASAISSVLKENRGKNKDSWREIVARYSWDQTAKTIMDVVKRYE